MTRLNAANNAQALLVGDITSADTSFYVDDASVFPTAPFLVTIDSEIILVNTVLANLFSSVTRAQESTIAAAHLGDSLVENRWTAGMYDALAILEDVPQNNFAATANATVNDDSSAGYGVGSTWINVALDTAYVCLDATVGAAVWELISGLATHLAETVSKVVLVTEPFDQVTKTTVNLGFRPKMVNIKSIILGTNYESESNSDGTYSGCNYTSVFANVKSVTTGAVFFYYDGSNLLGGAMAVTDTGIEIDWTLTGTLTGASGSRRLIISAITH